MPYNDNGNWVYTHEIPNNGDPVRIAGIVLHRAVESYLFDERHPGFCKPEFLSWSLAQYEVNVSSSGTHANNNALQWDPSKAEVYERPDGSKSYIPASQVDFGLKSEPPVFGDKADIGETDVYAPHEVADPSLARFRNDNAVVVQDRDARDFAPAPKADPTADRVKDGDA